MASSGARDARGAQGAREEADEDEFDDEDAEVAFRDLRFGRAYDEEFEVDAGKKVDAGAALDAGKRDGGRGHRRDAGDAGEDATAARCRDYVEQETSALDLLKCNQFDADECESYASERCPALHEFMDKQVFAAFVTCLEDTPGLDLCGEDRSTVQECEAEARALACKTPQPACEVYEGCESMTVDECNQAVAVFSASPVETFGVVYSCDISPAYFFD